MFFRSFFFLGIFLTGHYQRESLLEWICRFPCLHLKHHHACALMIVNLYLRTVLHQGSKCQPLEKPPWSVTMPGCGHQRAAQSSMPAPLQRLPAAPSQPGCLLSRRVFFSKPAHAEVVFLPGFSLLLACCLQK